MLWLFLRLAFLAGISYTADHNTYRDCSRIPFCTLFRGSESTSKYQADLSQLSDNDNVITIPLSSTGGDSLNLQISLLENNKARLKVLEKDNKKYELVDVLDGEPTRVGYKADNADSKVTLTPTDGQSYKIVVNKGPPFTVEFYNGDNLQVTFDSSRLAIQDGTDANNSEAFNFDVFFAQATGLYGLHHHPVRMLLKETADKSMDPYRLKNSDTAGYEVGSPMALYGAIPAVYGHSKSSTSGVFLHNAAQQWVDISYKDPKGPSAQFMAESGVIDVFVMLGPTVKEVVRQMTDITGRAHLPQYWALGYHQCRYCYQSQDEVKSVVSKMDENNFPMDAIWLDIDYTDGKRYFTWNPNSFSDPKGMQEFIANTNRKLVTIIDPHIKVDDDYFVYKGAKDKYFVKAAGGSADFQGNCWPGSSSWIDFLNPEARDYWVSLYAYSAFNGSTPTLAGTWNDMNEPALFNAYDSENSLPGDCVHTGTTGPVKHKTIHNAYGFLQSKASHEALLQRDGGKVRPFVLTRSHFAGSQRYAAHWTGDNQAQFPYLPITYSECILANILGHVFCGADIGGFEGNPGDNLIQRWYQAAVWIPFYRGHANTNTNHREPYVFSEDVQNVIRKAIRVRYKHIPVIYTLFYLHTRYGDPIIRPLFYDYPGMLDYDGQILVGSDIMGVPVMDQDSSNVQATFPGDSKVRWYRVDLDTVSVHYGCASETLDADINTSPYFYRGGGIVVTKNVEKKSTLDMLSDPFTVYVNLDADSFAEGMFYDDDHTSFDYENGQFYLLDLTSNGEYVNIGKSDGDLELSFTIAEVIVHTASKKDPRVAVRTVYNQTADGTLLRQINIGHLLRGTKQIKLKLK